MVVVFCLVAVAMVSPRLLRADVLTITVGTYIDGQDSLYIQGDTLKWQYGDYTPVGAPRGDVPDTNTYISTTLNGSPVMSLTPWQPVFASGPSSGQFSLPFTSLDPALPGSGIDSVSLVVNEGRETLDISQFPTPGNGETLILNFDDDADGGAGYYNGTVTVDYTPAGVTPEPGAIVLVGSGLLGLVGIARRKLSKNA
jgi:hypothetical protein